MTMHRLSLAVAVLFAGTAAYAEISAQSVAQDYQAQGFTRIEVRTGLTQIKVEAIKGTQKVEVVLDKATGAVLKRETEEVGLFENTTPGISIRERNRDFVRASSVSDDDNSEDDDGARSDDDDESDDDNGGTGSDDDGSDDDNGGTRSDDDSDDDAGDDNGGDRSSDDDDGSDDRGGSGSDDDDDDDDDDDSDDNSGSGGDDDSGSGSDDD